MNPYQSSPYLYLNQIRFQDYYIPGKFNDAQIRIFDLNGRSVKVFDIFAPGYGQIEIESHHMTAGIYYYELIIDDKRIDKKKMILQK